MAALYLFSITYLTAEAITYFAWNTYCHWAFFSPSTWELFCKQCYVTTFPVYCTADSLAYACNINPYSNPYNLKWCSWQAIPGICYTNPWQCPGIKDPPGGLEILQKLLAVFGTLGKPQFAQAQLLNEQQQQQVQHNGTSNTTATNYANLLAHNKQDLINHIPKGAIFTDRDPAIPGVTYQVKPGEVPPLTTVQIQQLAKSLDSLLHAGKIKIPAPNTVKEFPGPVYGNGQPIK